ncbi:hypothetical protein CDL15_Pgr017637 [Punica granatum]|uniref:Uncharacterized protein n=1 Tax=Punica granatum TaxID=22663 RepID=A0A218XS12_PUNGR|nr:hypothetical protein CDL15_Pgr017637 [Punica granatum]
MWKILYLNVVEDGCEIRKQTVRVDPTTLGTNDHHGHLEESLGYPRPPTLPQNSIGNLRGDVRPDLCQSGPKFQTCSVLGDFCRTVRVDPTTLGTNDHHGHLEGSLGYPRPQTLPQNSIGNLRGDVRPDLCQSGPKFQTCSVLGDFCRTVPFFSYP